MVADSERDFLDLMDVQTMEELDLNDPVVQETYDSFQRIETLFAKVRLPSKANSTPRLREAKPIELPGFSDLKKLGAGGFGEVYRAFDDRLQRQVAIKIPRFDRITIGNEREDYLQEARMAAKLNHPGLVKVHDLVTEKDRCLLISEYVEGRTLDEILKKEKLSIDRIIEIAIAICEAISHAHQRNVVHRDLKPANILIDSEGKPRITDFGLAIRADDENESTGFPAGTIEYMSPEQLPGSELTADKRSDIWSFGVVLYQMLTHQLPFRGSSRNEVFKQIIEHQPTPPSQLSSDVAKQLDAVCLKCLQKNPKNRYASAEELVSDLHATYRLRLPIRRKLLLSGLLLAPIIFSAAFVAMKQNAAPVLNPIGRIQITELQVRHFRYDESDLATDMGSIGGSSSQVQLNDDVRIGVQFDQPAYFHLMEFTSAGKLQHLSSNEPERPTNGTVFPSGQNDTIQLIDGEGFHVFVVVASPDPLPSFEKWKSQMEDIPWEKSNSAGVWRFAGGKVEGHFFRERSVVRSHQQPPSEFVRLCDYISSNNERCTVRAIGFSIEPLAVNTE